MAPEAWRSRNGGFVNLFVLARRKIEISYLRPELENLTCAKYHIIYTCEGKISKYVRFSVLAGNFSFARFLGIVVRIWVYLYVFRKMMKDAIVFAGIGQQPTASTDSNYFVLQRYVVPDIPQRGRIWSDILVKK